MKNVLIKILKIIIQNTRENYCRFSMILKFFFKASPKKLEFGCGPRVKKDFKGVDIRYFKGVYFLCNSYDINNYVLRNSVEQIYSRHFLEHLTYKQGLKTLTSWLEILKQGGSLEVELPDLDYHLDQFRKDWDSPAEFNNKFTNLEHALAGIYGWQREGETKVWDVHKSGYNFETLKKILLELGFTKIERVQSKKWNLHITALKK
tara:strand:+ start:656 stop:1270 length:615 start_codon:yes stop_codon:yes gene_type:complete